MGEVVPVEISVYDDHSFDFVMKSPPAAELIKKEAKISKGSGKPLSDKVASITKAQLMEIAKENGRP